MLVGLIDLGINNLSSVKKAFSSQLESDDSLKVVNDKLESIVPDLLILPGLGKFSAGMNALQNNGLDLQIRNWTNSGSKLVGICLGMQLLGTKSDESPGQPGLDLIPASVNRLSPEMNERVPHTGWANTELVQKANHFNSLGEKGDYYFVHSYHLVPDQDEAVLSETDFGSRNFVSAVLLNNILGFQFHPEKSGNKGKLLISEIIKWAKDEN
jgi:glutamine amidotransferase